MTLDTGPVDHGRPEDGQRNSAAFDCIPDGLLALELRGGVGALGTCGAELCERSIGGLSVDLQGAYMEEAGDTGSARCGGKSGAALTLTW